MKVKLDMQIVDMATGVVLTEQRNGEKVPLDSGSLFKRALLAGDDKMSGQEKYDRAVTVKKMDDFVEVDLTIEEIKTLKDACGKAYVPGVVYQLWELLEGRAELKSVKQG